MKKKIKADTSIGVWGPDKKKFKQMTLNYNTSQVKLFHALVHIGSKFKPEIEELLK